MSNDVSNQQLSVTFNGTTITQVENITPPNFEVETYTVAYIGDSFERVTPTIIKAASVTVTTGYDPTQHNFLYTAFAAKTVAPAVFSQAAVSGGAGAVTFTCANSFISKFAVVGGDAKTQSKLQFTMQFSGSVVQS